MSACECLWASRRVCRSRATAVADALYLLAARGEAVLSRSLALPPPRRERTLAWGGEPLSVQYFLLIFELVASQGDPGSEELGARCGGVEVSGRPSEERSLFTRTPPPLHLVCVQQPTLYCI